MPGNFLDRMISIIYNLLFNIGHSPQEDLPKDTLHFPLEFYKLMRSIYKGLEQNQDKLSHQTMRKIIAIVVISTANDANHFNVVMSKFYAQMKTNLNRRFAKTQTDEDIELFGLINLALNKKVLHLIHHDLIVIHRLAEKSNKIDFKTRVDLFSEISKFIVMVSR